MRQINGEYQVRIDSKGRIKMPKALLDQVEGELVFTVNRGFEKHLMLYPGEIWERKTKEINKLNIYNRKHRAAIRYFFRGATKLVLDATDRVRIPKSLLEYANIEKDAVLFAYQNQIELWAAKDYELSLDEEPEDFSEILSDEAFNDLGAVIGENDEDDVS